MTRADRLLRGCVAELRASGDPEPRRTLSLLASAVTGAGAWDWMLGMGPVPDDAAAEQIAALCRRRLSGVPLQRLLGVTWFFGYRFETPPDVLIPRPDTEVLVTAALERVSPSPDGVFRYADIGTGTGCAGLSVARELDRTGVRYEAHLTDLSDAALRCARRNLALLAPIGPVRVVRGDLFPPGGTGRLNMILSNPPYIPTGDIPNLMPEVAEQEPREALDGGPDGLDVIRRLIGRAPSELCPGGWLLTEHGFDQGFAVRGLLDGDGRYVEIRTIRDYAGQERVTAGRTAAAEREAGADAVEI